MHAPQFKPHPLFNGCHRQTIISTFVNFCRAPFSRTEYVHLPDHDWLAMEVTTPPSWTPDQLTVVMVHGLCGSHKSPYQVRMARKLAAKGVRAIRVNLRGCGSGKGLARNPYAAGCSKDILCAIQQIKFETPNSSIVLMGFSLGGNIVLKLAGELGAEAPIDRVIAVSPPADLMSSMKLIEKPQNRIYERYFMKHLMDDLNFRYKTFPEAPHFDIPKELRALDYDSYYLAPLFGYQNVFDYYRNNRALEHIHNISIPCQILFAEDDPIIDASMLDHCQLPENIEIFKTASGGHLGYISAPGTEGGIRWLDYFLLNLIFGSKSQNEDGQQHVQNCDTSSD